MKRNNFLKLSCSRWVLAAACAVVFNLGARASDDAANQSPLAPKLTAGGVLFQESVVGATSLYLAADFNNWANNKDSVVTDAASKMDGPDAKGLWTKTLKVGSGTHKMKFVRNGAATGWTTPTWAQEVDPQGNGVFYVLDSGDVLLRNPVNPAWEPQQTNNTVTFKFFDPNASAVYLAGDFNKWAENEHSVVSKTQYKMTKGDDGVWQIQCQISPGPHFYKFVIDGNRWTNDPNGGPKDSQGRSTITIK